MCFGIKQRTLHLLLLARTTRPPNLFFHFLHSVLIQSSNQITISFNVTIAFIFTINCIFLSIRYFSFIPFILQFCSLGFLFHMILFVHPIR
uniref:Uncharacterized protein n=1 Tax=Rhizophora mucronata TaxID=61149 RepID=A0A2P2Q5U1_RHIMU